MSNENFQSEIKRLIIDNGRNIVKKDKAIQGYIEDTLSAYPAQKNISINLAKEGILKELGNKNTLSETELKSYTNQIVNRYGTDSHLTKKTIEAWAEALGIKFSKIQQKGQIQSHSKHQTSNPVPSTLKQNESSRQTAYNSTKQKGFFGKLMAGDYGLAKTYWVYGFLVNLLFSFVITLSMKTGSKALLLLFFSLGSIWSIIVMIGIWNVAKKYTGSKLWSFLARVAVILGMLSIVFQILVIFS